jgi:uncharacterized membrane protein
MIQPRTLFFENPRFLNFLFGFIVVTSLLLTLIIPPFQKTDEVSHFYKTVSVASGHFFCTSDTQGHLVNQISAPYFSLPTQLFADFVNKDPTHRFPRHSVIEVLTEKPNFQETAREDISCTLPFFFYLPVGILLALPIALGVNPLITFYLGRLFFCGLALIGFFLAKKITPVKFQPLLLITLSLPMVLIQIGSYNKEVFLLTFGALSFALLFRLREKFSFPKFVLLFLSLILFIAPRPQFFPLLSLLFLSLPHFNLRKILSKMSWIVLLGVIFLILATSLAMLFYIPKVVQLHSPVISAQGIAPSLQIEYLQHFPLSFVSTLFNSYTNHIDAYYKSMVGSLGSIHTHLDWYVYNFYAAVFLALIYHYSRFASPFRKEEWGIIFSALFLTTLALFLSFYIYATPVGYEYVVDVQGRYFVMLLPYVLLFLSYLVKRLGQKIWFIGMAVVLIFLLGNVYSRYYDYTDNFYSLPFPSNLTKLQVDQKTTGQLDVDSTKKLRGLSFSMNKFDGHITLPYLLTVYDSSCQKQLGQGVMKTYLYKESALVNVPINSSISHQSSVCFSLEPMGANAIKNNNPLFLLGDSTTQTPTAEPLYDH